MRDTSGANGKAGSLRRSASSILTVKVLMLVHAALLAWSATRHSPVLDEVGHLPAGVSHWQLGRFDLYRVNPPLVRSIAALPLVASSTEFHWHGYNAAPAARPEFRIGRRFIQTQGVQAFEYFTQARWACIPISLVGLGVCTAWAHRLYGSRAGLMAGMLWCFSPNILGHASLITPDVGAAAFGVLACFLFWRFLQKPGWTRCLVAGIALGLALLTKTTWVILPVILPGIGVVTWLRHRPVAGIALPEFAKLLTIPAIGLYILNLGYGFEGTLKPLGEYTFVSRTLTGRTPSSVATGNRFEGTLLAGLPLPLPENYVLGIDVQKQDFELGRFSYLCGEHRHGGWWWYYFYAMLVKMPAGTVGLLVAAVVGSLRIRGKAGTKSEWVLLAPIAVVLLLVSSQTGFNRHLRYALPAFPFLFVWISRVACHVGRPASLRSVGAAGLLVWSGASSLYAFPHSLSYFNELAVGSGGGHRHLLGSNLDWGQDLRHLMNWRREHPEAEPFHIAWHGTFDPADVGFEYQRVPMDESMRNRSRLPEEEQFGPVPGWHAVSVNLVHSPHGEYAWLQARQPCARAGPSIWIYYVPAFDIIAAQRDIPKRDHIQFTAGAVSTSCVVHPFLSQSFTLYSLAF